MAGDRGEHDTGQVAIDRVTGLMVVLLGAALLLFVVPEQVETVAYGWVRPHSVPNALAIALILLGLVQLLAKPASDDRWPRPAARAGFYLGYAAIAAAVMDWGGFAWVAPPMVLGLMLLLGERRPLWLGLGGIVVPGTIWLVVVPLLDRSLPG